MKVGYDGNDDDDIEDTGTNDDHVVISEDFQGTAVDIDDDHANPPDDGWDKNGNLRYVADYTYVYDAWDKLVRVEALNDEDVVTAEYEVYGDNRRAKQTVTNRGDLDSTGVFCYDGAREIAEYNSAETTGTLTQAYVWGTQYVDELRTIRRCLRVPRLPRPSTLPWRQVCPVPRVIDSRCHETALYRLLSC